MLKQGGMGAVWVATHLGLDESVALKFMDPRRVSSVEARLRFTREAKAAAQIRSKNIVQILDHGVDGHVPYIAMELLTGEDLGARLRLKGRLSMSEAASLLDDIAHALDRAHAAGIVHRDLKPENIFLAKDGDHEVPKILDFGIALEVQEDASDDSAATAEGVILGTPYFMSPEQVRGRANIDHRSDLWSLGVILFRAVTGIRPFGRGAPADIIVQICSDPIPRASVVARDLPDAVDRFFEKALARDVNKRFSSAKEMAAAFNEIAKAAELAEKTGSTTLVQRTRRTPPPLPVTPEITPPPLPPEPHAAAPEPAPEPAAEDTAKTDEVMQVAPEELREVSTAPVSVDVTPVPAKSAPARSAPAATPIPSAIETPKTAEIKPATETRPSRSGEPRSFVWVGVVGVIAAAAIGFGLRDRLFAPPQKEPTTIVLTAGTVVLMGPAGPRASVSAIEVTAPVAASAAPSASESASATASASASSQAAPEATSSEAALGSGAAAASAVTSASASATATEPPKTLHGKMPEPAASATDAKASGSDTKASGSDTKVSGSGAKTSANDTKPSGGDAKPSGGDSKPPPKKDDHDLGY
jgi:serine/threonine-protein kinase